MVNGEGKRESWAFASIGLLRETDSTLKYMILSSPGTKYLRQTFKYTFFYYNLSQLRHRHPRRSHRRRRNSGR